MTSPELLYKLQMACWNSCENQSIGYFVASFYAGFARTSFCSLEMIWKNWGCRSIVEPNCSRHEAIGLFPSTSRQQQKEWSGGASGCRHGPPVTGVRVASARAPHSVLELSLWLDRIKVPQSGSQASGELIKVVLPWCWFLFRVTSSFAGPTPMFDSSLQFSAPYAGRILTLLFFCNNIVLLKVFCLMEHRFGT